MNLCRGCNQDFGSVRLFDRHRVGVHEYTFAEGLRRDPPVEDGRRCLDRSEMLQRGWRLGVRGVWIDPSLNRLYGRTHPENTLKDAA